MQPVPRMAAQVLGQGGRGSEHAHEPAAQPGVGPQGRQQGVGPLPGWRSACAGRRQSLDYSNQAEQCLHRVGSGPERRQDTGIVRDRCQDGGSQQSSRSLEVAETQPGQAAGADLLTSIGADSHGFERIHPR